jgi:hypothetical protein
MNVPPLRLTEPPNNTPEQCDSVLGAYLRAWDQVEMQLLPLFGKMLGTHQNATLVLLSVGINQPTLRTILESLATIRVNGDDRSTLTAIVRRWETASAKRNRIVHGHWALIINMVEGPSGKRDHTKSTWVRSYSPTDPTAYDRMFGKQKDQKLLAKHQFSLDDISQATVDVRALAADLLSFNQSANILDFVTPRHMAIDQSNI